jgi:hypothetical protein
MSITHYNEEHIHQKTIRLGFECVKVIGESFKKAYEIKNQIEKDAATESKCICILDIGICNCDKD